AKTVSYKGNRIDIGGHRFFSKSSRVMDWWATILPLQRLGASAGADGWTSGLGTSDAGGPDPDDVELVMLIRERRSRIMYLRRMFDYPVSLNATTVRNLGPARMVRIGASYLRARLRPIRDEVSLEDFMINRFGRELYATFFEDYTEKVWGVPPKEIKADWGAQRIKGLSVSRALVHAARGLLPRARGGKDIYQREIETSLIERFLYPKRGPGQLWEEVTRRIVERGGQVILNTAVTAFHADGRRITAVTVRDRAGEESRVEGDYFFSTMPIRELIAGLDADVPELVRAVAAGLEYRDFITVGVLLRRRGDLASMTDNWIYVQEPDVKVGRLQIFNNWSPYLVAEPDTIWVGMEYFANEGDELWSLGDEQFAQFAINELCALGLVERDDVLDHTVLHVPKAYPAYFGTYERFEIVRGYIDHFADLFLIGRNGMHRYNNQDHSMLTAMVAVENIAAGIETKDNIWAVNVEQEYHETKQAEEAEEVEAPAGHA
ncbi:MAG TPA: NAD(P)/FAD-dependent oxidoreductase, partial [Solirubrobacteraceae bacterium]|nr:NAD(P)/FAD-dependent oxidoreductase [Solirubrobacteraceae bacterium]